MADSISACLLFKNKTNTGSVAPATMLTFIPEAAITWSTPVLLRASRYSLSKLPFSPNSIPKSKPEASAGSVFLKLSDVFSFAEVIIGSFNYIFPLVVLICKVELLV